MTDCQMPRASGAGKTMPGLLVTCAEDGKFKTQLRVRITVIADGHGSARGAVPRVYFCNYR